MSDSKNTEQNLLSFASPTRLKIFGHVLKTLHFHTELPCLKTQQTMLPAGRRNLPISSFFLLRHVVENILDSIVKVVPFFLGSIKNTGRQCLGTLCDSEVLTQHPTNKTNTWMNGYKIQ